LKIRSRIKFILLAGVLLAVGCAGPTKMADTFFKQKDYRQAISSYRTALKKDSTNVKAWVHLGESYRAVGKLDSAKWSFKKASRLKPKDPEIKHLLLETDYLQAVKMAKDSTYRWEAVRKLTTVLEKDSTYLPALLERGKLYESLGELDLAGKDYAKAVRLNPGQIELKKKIERFETRRRESEAWTKKAAHQLQRKRYLKAIADLKKALTLKPDNERAQYLLHMAKGRYYYKRGSLGRIWDAIEEFGKASALEPNNPEPHFYMAKAYYKKDKRDYDNTIREYEEAVKLAPQSSYAKIARKEIKKLKRLQKIWKRFWRK